MQRWAWSRDEGTRSMEATGKGIFVHLSLTGVAVENETDAEFQSANDDPRA
jgi:hypothetical protein